MITDNMINVVRKMADEQFNDIDNDDNIGFECGGQWIVNPWYERSARFEVNPVEEYGKEKFEQFVSDCYKVFLLKEICNWYNYEVILKDQFGQFVFQNKDYSFASPNIDDLLKDWLSTLEESNRDCDMNNERHLWSDEEIEFIKRS